MGDRKKVKKKKVRLAHELPKRRRMAIQEALNAHKTEDRPEWDRTANWGNIKLFRKTIKTGTLRTISLPIVPIPLCNLISSQRSNIFFLSPLGI